MGLFKKIRKVATRTVTAVATGGLSEVARATGAKPLAQVAESVFAPTSISDLQTTASILTGQGPGVQATAGPSGGGGDDMALGNILGGFGGLLSTVGQFGGPVGTVAQIGSGFLSGFLPAQGPMVQQAAFPSAQFPQATQTMAMMPAIRGAGTAIANFVAPILAKMSITLGKNITLRAAMIIVRRLGKTLTSPGAVAAALGLSIAELSSLLTANALAGSSGKRMNPGNVKALRRAHRRIKSFHKLCGENDRLKAPRRRSAPKTILVSGKRCD